MAKRVLFLKNKLPVTFKVNKEIIVSKSVFEKTKDYFEFEDLNEISLAGRKRTIQAYAVDPFLKKHILSTVTRNKTRFFFYFLLNV